jgi:DNA repair exonuclease SbcCD ATPase subunit
MKDQSEIWRQRIWIWLPALLFFLANAVAFSVYRFGYAGQVQSLESDMEAVREQLKPLEQQRTLLERRLQRARAAETEVQRLYEDRFSTRSQRLTRIMSEVRTLARQAGLNPKSISYPLQDIEDYGLEKRSFVFQVGGTYAELRQFLNLLELTDSFLTLEAATLSEEGGDEGPELQMNLTLSTLFAREAGDEAVLRRTAPRSGA